MEQVEILTTVLRDSTSDKKTKKKSSIKLNKLKEKLVEEQDKKESKEKWKQEITAAQQKDWQDIEDLVTLYQRQFDESLELSIDETEEAKMAGYHLIKKFEPLIKKYLTLIKTAQINFEDAEMKRFVNSFIGDNSLKCALKRTKQTAKYRHPILLKFNFVKETYGALTEDEITTDLQMLLLVLAKRYKQMGKNFCAYVYNVYCYEVSRHIKKFIKDPSNIHYRNVPYEDFMQVYSEVDFEESCSFEDKIYEDNMGIPDLSWISGMNCSDIFQELEPLERKLLIKYYLEDYNDRQIAEEFSMHINTVNQKRRRAVFKLAHLNGIDKKNIKRSRKSGKQAMLDSRL